MKATALYLEPNYVDRLYAMFEEYCYNFFDESYMPKKIDEWPSWEKIPLFIVFVTIFQIYCLVYKSNQFSLSWLDQGKEIRVESVVEESTVVVNDNEQKRNHKTPERIQCLGGVKSNILHLLNDLSKPENKLYSRNCAFLN